MFERGFIIRTAGRSDVPAIRSMHGRSMRVLGGAFYPADAIAAFLEQIGTMDDALVHEGHYFVAVNAYGAVLGSGGWSRLRPRHARADDAETPPNDAATIRSIFVDPLAARRGMGSAIMARAEEDATRRGVATLRLTATLSGVPFYSRLGYRAMTPKALRLGSGMPFACVLMEKWLQKLERQAA